ncbi:MAG: hypothetical protein KBI41_11060 [Kiritimatiellae bacterium]|jgi:hypothetical protein|nr:hypothetical protein [Kiritimatiellia bacterium]MDD2349311.1 hypothetical protein [Kiritimatiellia bacterium]MDD3585293.1 hypothetical protein [Kiritimatiellia bacterium]HHU14585.1 hypothetical protein [Lentisphaerota bacterium]HON48439.1 hypothetical protein [Kiritimatiellia bacterium]
MMNGHLLIAVSTIYVPSAGRGQRQEEKDTMFGMKKAEKVHRGEFGTCCKDLADCLKQPNALIRKQEDGRLFLTIGYMETDQGTGWFDHAVIYCPFCGSKLQDRKALADTIKDR